MFIICVCTCIFAYTSMSVCVHAYTWMAASCLYTRLYACTCRCICIGSVHNYVSGCIRKHAIIHTSMQAVHPSMRIYGYALHDLFLYAYAYRCTHVYPCGYVYMYMSIRAYMYSNVYMLVYANAYALFCLHGFMLL